MFRVTRHDDRRPVVLAAAHVLAVAPYGEGAHITLLGAVQVETAEHADEVCARWAVALGRGLAPASWDELEDVVAAPALG